MTAELMPLREALSVLLQYGHARGKILGPAVFYGDPQTDPSYPANKAELERLQAAIATIETFARSQAATVDPAQIRLL